MTDDVATVVEDQGRYARPSTWDIRINLCPDRGTHAQPAAVRIGEPPNGRRGASGPITPGALLADFGASVARAERYLSAAVDDD